MRDYGVVSPKFWIGETGKQLRGDNVAQLIALYLMTSPHAAMTGVYHCPLFYISHDTGIAMQGSKKALRRLIQAGFCEYEDPSETIFVVRMAAYQIAESLKPDDKRVVGLKREVDKMTCTRLKQRFLEVYGRVFHLVAEGWIGSPNEGPSKPHASQDHDHDHDQEHDHDHDQEQTTSAEASDVDIVFRHWQSVHAHPRSALDDKRRTLITKQLKIYSADALCQAITGYLNSPYHMGKNESQTKYDDIELMLRDAKHIDAGIKFHVEPPRADLSAKTRQIIDQTENWVPPEARNASH